MRRICNLVQSSVPPNSNSPDANCQPGVLAEQGLCFLNDEEQFECLPKITGLCCRRWRCSTDQRVERLPGGGLGGFPLHAEQTQLHFRRSWACIGGGRARQAG